ncbi:MAG: tRNA pseudouridine(38-40) synthase TruA [Actinomycetia bacterium]|nr:tRNA pseudouridine(38-40) synthase TruA [Actinomycetes bacterium]
MTSRTIALTVSYDGAAFAGFARQPGRRTVQGELEAALAIILRAPVATTGAGRTDAGVHALGQVVSFAAPETSAPEGRSLLRSLNALTGPDVVVTGVRLASPAFDARHSAVGREYRYRIVPGPVPPLFCARTAWWVDASLDLVAMREAARYLIGEHDFRSFCVAGSAKGKRTYRRIDVIDIAPTRELGEHCLVIRVVGNAFLHSMVRIIVGSLVEVGRGLHDPSWMGEALVACDRAAAGVTAPAHGLTLWYVEYPDEYWL